MDNRPILQCESFANMLLQTPPPLKLPPNISPLWGVFAPPVAIINTSLHPTTNTFGASLNFNVFTFSAERSRKDLFLPFSNFEHSISVLILSSVTPFPLYNYAMGPKYSVIFTQPYIPAPVSDWMTHTTNKQMSQPKNSSWCHNAMLKSILLIVTKRPLSELNLSYLCKERTTKIVTFLYFWPLKILCCFLRCFLLSPQSNVFSIWIVFAPYTHNKVSPPDGSYIVTLPFVSLKT